MSTLPNKSKPLGGADDSAARLLGELLDGSPGRNFDIESIFVERRSDDRWRFVIFEFLKADTISPRTSHPNYYWHRNKRKFLSLWTVTKALRKAGFDADLILVNYNDERTEIKVMTVSEVTENPTEVLREQKLDANGNEVKKRIMNWVSTTKERVMSFAEFKNIFRKYNDTKLGGNLGAAEATVIASHGA